MPCQQAHALDLSIQVRVNLSLYMQFLAHRDVTWWPSEMITHTVTTLASAQDASVACPLAFACMHD